MIVPVPLVVALNELYVPLPDNVKLFKFSDVVPGSNAVAPKSNVLNQLPEVIVATLAPVLNVRFGALDADPPLVLPKPNVLALLMSFT